VFEGELDISLGRDSEHPLEQAIRLLNLKPVRKLDKIPAGVRALVQGGYEAHTEQSEDKWPFSLQSPPLHLRIRIVGANHPSLWALFRFAMIFADYAGGCDIRCEYIVDGPERLDLDEKWGRYSLDQGVLVVNLLKWVEKIGREMYNEQASRPKSKRRFGQLEKRIWEMLKAGGDIEDDGEGFVAVSRTIGHLNPALGAHEKAPATFAKAKRMGKEAAGRMASMDNSEGAAMEDLE
jgi:hypothetical protein